MSNMTTADRVWPQTLSGVQARKFLGMSQSTFYTLKAAGKLPAPVSIGMTRLKWRLEDLKKYVESLK